MVEFKRDVDGTYWLMEINPRFWGSLALSIDAGIDFPRVLLGLAAGVRAVPQPKYQVGYATRHFPSDVDWMKENWRADHQDSLLLTRPRLQSVVEYFRLFVGRESWDHFDRGDLGIVWGQVVDVCKSLVLTAVKHARAAASRWRLVWTHRRTVRRLSRKQVSISRLLFVCYGNICRSPFAEIMARKVLAGFDVASAGFYPVDRRTTPMHVQLIAEEIGIEMATHRSQCLDDRMVAWADLIVVMDRDNFDHLRSKFPQAREKVIALGLVANPATTEIADPYSMDIAQTRVVLRRIQTGLEGLVALMGNDGRATV
jgi:protein-tyrosine-phosphatase